MCTLIKGALCSLVKGKTPEDNFYIKNKLIIQTYKENYILYE